MRFVVLEYWENLIDHVQDSYFCIVNPIKCLTGKNAKEIFYANLPSMTALVPHSENFPVPSCIELNDSKVSLSETSSASYDSKDFLIKSVICEQLINSKDLSNLVRGVNLPKSKAEVLASQLKQWNLKKSSMKTCLLFQTFLSGAIQSEYDGGLYLMVTTRKSIQSQEKYKRY